MIQDKIKKGDLIRVKRDTWGSYWSSYGHINFEIKKNIIFIALTDQMYIPEASITEVDGLIDNRIVTIIIRDDDQLDII